MIDRYTNVGKGMGLCLYIAHVDFDRIVPRGVYSMHMNMNSWLIYKHASVWYDEVCICVVSKCVYVKGFLM